MILKDRPLVAPAEVAEAVDPAPRDLARRWFLAAARRARDEDGAATALASLANP